MDGSNLCTPARRPSLEDKLEVYHSVHSSLLSSPTLALLQNQRLSCCRILGGLQELHICSLLPYALNTHHHCPASLSLFRGRGWSVKRWDGLHGEDKWKRDLKFCRPVKGSQCLFGKGASSMGVILQKLICGSSYIDVSPTKISCSNWLGFVRGDWI